MMHSGNGKREFRGKETETTPGPMVASKRQKRWETAGRGLYGKSRIETKSIEGKKPGCIRELKEVENKASQKKGDKLGPLPGGTQDWPRRGKKSQDWKNTGGMGQESKIRSTIIRNNKRRTAKQKGGGGEDKSIYEVKREACLTAWAKAMVRS